MRRVLRRHDAITNDNYIALKNAGNVFIMPRFSHVMMDNRLVEVNIPESYYKENKEVIDSMERNTQAFIQNLREI
jgi:predicted protein tyrosine phosphatase